MNMSRFPQLIGMNRVVIFSGNIFAETIDGFWLVASELV